ncbi:MULTISPECIES: beta-mannosidase [Saccharibacillus]|uniref:beta-mannosidase n=1 Tax=Saccharibacillus TaxID=456492 RepID=UPI00123B1924|nr:glycoside hydrolase family 2 protein [Saccharibacillus sp. WB 17]MWJ30861.1 glycoside hydrolase family 2 protein [Saccharibacillus sp. WB 17]
MELGGNWRIKDFAPGETPAQDNAAAMLDDRYWMTGSVPGDVHSALIRRKVIEDPYFGHNDLKSRWIEEREWWYRRGFEYGGALTREPGERFELNFDGLDTFATVFVNGHEIGTSRNMLMPHTFDITRVIRPGWNVIAVRFDPLRPHHQGKERFDWSSYTKERPWLRKAAMNFGWDWGPRLVTVGIWGAVTLKRHRLAKIESVFAETRSIENGAANLVISADVTTYRGMPDVPLTLKLSLADGDGRRVYETEVSEDGAEPIRAADPDGASVPAFETDFRPESGTRPGVLAASPVTPGRRSALRRQAAFRAECVLPDARLWWTHDLGEPHLYTLTADLYAGDERIHTDTQAIGVRTIELRTEDEEGRAAFRFFLNGKFVYARGANWIPADNSIGSIPDSRYGELIGLSAESGMNMLRIWGGGIYEKEIFYDECDRRGVLVWQDFAFANALFPDFNADFMDNVRAEVEANVTRLRGRASLALWCGNNEIDWLYDMKSASGDIKSDFYGERIYHELIPEALERLDPHRAYWPSSPYGRSGDQDDNDPDVGDRHNWQVWHGSVYPRAFGEMPALDYSIEGVTFKNYKQDMALFSSEFGMHASANRYTLEKNMPEGSLVWGGEEMAYRNKDTNHRKGILLMEGYTGLPRDIEQYMNFSMLTQAEGLRYGVEHYRRNPRSGGSLIWQLNDSWPGTSWAMIDYELLPKASYYYAKQFYRPLLLSLEHEPGQPLRVWAVNDGPEPVEAEVLLEVRRFDGERVGEYVFRSDGVFRGPVLLGEVGEAEALNGGSAEETLVRLRHAGGVERVSGEGGEAEEGSRELRGNGADGAWEGPRGVRGAETGKGGEGWRREERGCEQTYMLRDQRELKLGEAKLAWSVAEAAQGGQASSEAEAAEPGANAGELPAAWRLDGRLADVTAAAVSEGAAEAAGNASKPTPGSGAGTVNAAEEAAGRMPLLGSAADAQATADASGESAQRRPASAGSAAGSVIVTVEASGTLARMVKLELPLGRVRFSDNFFDLLPGERRDVELSMLDGSPLDEEFVRSRLRVSALNGAAMR